MPETLKKMLLPKESVKKKKDSFKTPLGDIENLEDDVNELSRFNTKVSLKARLYFRNKALMDKIYSKEKKIISNSNKEITIIFPINNVLINEVSFQLKFKEKNLEEKFNDLFNLVEKQQKEINNLKKEIEELKKRKK
jgi:hypothetical protein